MMTTIESYVRRSRYTLKRWAGEPRVRGTLRVGAYLLTGFLFSAASLRHLPLPLVLGLLCAFTGWQAVLLAMGGVAGYLFFWAGAGLQCVVWTALGLLAALAVGEKSLTRETPLLLPALAAAVVAVVGVVFQTQLNDRTMPPDYLLRVVLAAASGQIFRLAVEKKEPVAKWLATALGVLALAQVVPVRFLGLGFVACGMVSVGGPFPMAALSGLALDLAKVTPVPMTAVACGVFLLRLLPRGGVLLKCAAPMAVYSAVMGVCGYWDMAPIPALALGGVLGLLVPGQAPAQTRRGEIGVLQVRLELAAGVLAQTQQLLMEAQGPPIDEQALVSAAAQRACGSCPCRRTCREKGEAAELSPKLLHRPLLDDRDLPIACRKSGRLLSELHRGQEKLRSLRGERERQREYRGAVQQQYGFLAAYLQELSDSLTQRPDGLRLRFSPKVSLFGNRPQPENGDRCLHFAGTGGKYYVLLCDGMGTGMGAVNEGETAAGMLKKLLCAGFPAEYALRSLNSLCALRGAAGAVTVDLAEISMETGKAALYKWGAAPSYLISNVGAERIGAATAPPGISIGEDRERVERLSLRRGEALLLLSDGVETKELALLAQTAAPEDLAKKLLLRSTEENTDDATVAVITLTETEK